MDGPRIGAAMALVVALTLPLRTAAGETIVLTSGRTIVADEAWYEAGELRYRQAGALFAVPRTSVASVTAPPGTEPLVDPDLRRSRERLAAGDPGEALRFARLALFRDAGSKAARTALAEAQLALGDPARARATLEATLAEAPRDARTLELLGDALADLGEFPAARERFADSLAASPEPRVRAKLDALVAMPPQSSRARFLLRYDGEADEPLGLAVLAELDRAFGEYEARLGAAPAQPVEVVLQTAASFRDTTRAPGWVAAWNDGAIRVPVAGLDAPTPGLVRVLRHELVHTFVAARAGAECPTWLQEGLAQWLSGSDAAREGAALAAVSATLPRIESLEKPFTGLSERQATLAYAQSLSVVVHIARTRGERAILSLLDALAAGRPAAEALPETLGVSYAELQREWEKSLRSTATAETRR
ncbi:MAG: tetratricopeptide repeat protein [Vicinamibacteria bacterium]